MSKEQEERYALVAERARKQLETGTWPQVMMVFGYTNPRPPRVPEEEFEKLKTFYEQAGCQNMALFIQLVRFEEAKYNVTMSFNLSMCPRPQSENTEPTAEDVMVTFATPDILVGTRNGVVGAIDWFRKTSEDLSKVPPEAVQVFDKIFSEAVQVLKNPGKEATLADIAEAASGKGTLLDPPRSPLQN